MIPVMRYLRQILSGSGLPLVARATALAIASHCNADGYADPSAEGLAEILGRDPGTVRRHIYELEAAGILAVTRARGRRNVYRFPVSAPAAIVHNGARLGARTSRRVATLKGARFTPQGRATDRAPSARGWARAEADVVEAASLDDGAAPRTFAEAQAIMEAARREGLAELGVVNL